MVAVTPAMVTIAVSDRTELRATDRGAATILIGDVADHVTLLFHGDRVAAIDRLLSELFTLRRLVDEAVDADREPADDPAVPA